MRVLHVVRDFTVRVHVLLKTSLHCAVGNHIQQGGTLRCQKQRKRGGKNDLPSVAVAVFVAVRSGGVVRIVCVVVRYPL